MEIDEKTDPSITKSVRLPISKKILYCFSKRDQFQKLWLELLWNLRILSDLSYFQISWHHYEALTQNKRTSTQY